MKKQIALCIGDVQEEKMNIKQIAIRIVVCALCVCMMIWYAESRIINIGSVAGTVFFLAVGLCAVFYDKLRALLKKLRKKKGMRIFTNLLLIAALAGVLHVAVISCLMTAYALKTPTEPSTLVVLGCQVNGTSPSLMLKRRIEAAYRYLEAHPDTLCVLSGGKGENEEISEAECMYEQLVKAGIDPGRLYKEDKSSTTEENLRFTYRLIEEKGLNRELAIVTDGFHEFRAAMIAEKLGLHCTAVPSDTPLYLAANFTTREMIAVTAELFRSA